MKKKQIIIGIAIMIIVVFIIFLMIKNNNKKYDGNGFVAINNIYTNIDKNQIEYNENTNVEELKQESGKTGDSNIYEVET